MHNLTSCEFSEVSSGSLWEISSTVHFFRAALLLQHDISRRTSQTSRLLGNVNIVVAHTDYVATVMMEEWERWSSGD